MILERLAPELDLLVAEIIEIAATIVPVLVVPAVGADAGVVIIEPRKMPLPRVRRAVAVIAKALPHILHADARHETVGPRAIEVRKVPREDRAPRGCANRAGRVRPIKAHALRGEAIEMRRLQPRPPIAPDHAGALCVGHNEDEVGAHGSSSN